MTTENLDEKRELNDEFAAACIELTVALDAWKNAGDDALNVTNAIRRLVSAITACERFAIK